MNVVREELRLKSQSGPRAVGSSALSVLVIQEVGCIDLHAGRCSKDLHDASARRVTDFSRKEKFALSRISVDDIVVVVTADQSHLLLFGVHVPADRFRLGEIQRGALRTTS